VREWADYGLAAAALRDPWLPPLDLAAIAAAQPTLRVQVAAHPQAYQGLSDWLWAVGDEQVRAAVAWRRTVKPLATTPGGVVQLVPLATLYRPEPGAALRQGVGKVMGAYCAAVATIQLIAPMVLVMLLMLILPGSGWTIQDGLKPEKIMPWYGWVMIASVAGGALWYLMLRGRRLVTTDITTTTAARGRWALLGKLTVVMFLGQAINALFTALMSLTGYDASTSNTTVNALFGSLSGVLYIVVIGPFLEEVMFRGAILRHLAPYGANFAIVTQAVLFGLYHFNFTQGVFAFFIGLIFGYVALHYSLKWSYALHALNNGLVVVSLISPLTQSAFMQLVAVATVGAIIILATGREQVRTLVAAGRSATPHPFRAGWNNTLFIIITIVIFLISLGTTVMVLFLRT